MPPSVNTNPSDIGHSVKAGAYLYEGVFTPLGSTLAAPTGDLFGPYGTYSAKLAKGDYVQPWTSSSGGATIVARPHSDGKPVGIIIDQPLGFPQGIDPTSSAARTLSARSDMRQATIEWLHGFSINRVAVREALKAATIVGYSATGSDWTTTSAAITGSFSAVGAAGMLLESSSAGGYHAVLVMG